ncbi:AAA family ATPase [Microbacterium hominis]|uniref:AAA family ATPase n=1 Tax=Microbacterium hominis TaxID=162426 RepID=UPI001962B048|nr:AAA family ATPase [Microbacterium hominis]QRY40858.1 AAA family ATPase [Microbacterium hominis]
MTGLIDFKDLAAFVDRNLEPPADWDSLTQQQREESMYGQFVNAIADGYRAAKIKETVEAMRVEPQPFVVSTESDILTRPSPEWLVQDLIQSGTICLLAGPGGLGKSFLALAIARALASGGPFFGKRTRQGKTLYVVAEGAAAFGDRVRAWDAAHPMLRVPADAIAYVEQGVNLKDSASVETLSRLVADGDYSLVILDTLSQLAYLDNENSNAEVALTFRAIKSIRDAREGTSVLVIDHTPVQGGKVRGATSKRDNSDTVVMAIPVGERGEGGFSLSTRNDDGGKQKDGQAIEWHGFALQPFETSAIVVNNGGKRPLSPYWGKSLEVLRDGKAHSSTELKDACGIDGDMRSAEGKRLARELEHWVRDELVSRTGSRTRPLYTASAGVLAVTDE